jgi:2',3'-cyclic-nucleotide 2'-phosphodiesterase (5'-nucleotidase family)
VVFEAGARRIESVRIGGEPIDPAATYRLATSSYLLYTDHEFPTLEESHGVERGDLQYDVLVEYARERGIAPEIEGRIRFV